MTDRYADLRAGLESLQHATGELRGPEAQVAALLADYDEAERALVLAGKANKDLMDAVLELKAERDRLRAAAQMLADWAEHEVGAGPDLTPGLSEARAALTQQEQGK